jgi:serine/threonine-protein kinase RsbW
MSCNPTDACPHLAEDHGAGAVWRTCALRRGEELEAVIHELMSALEAAGFKGKEGFAVRLAAEEAIVNGLKHGHGYDPTKEVRVRYRVTPTCAYVEIRDQGPGFIPEEVPDPLDPENLERPCGRGLFLMRNYMTWVRYSEGGTCVALCKRRTT